jgi:hypothetical protein
MYTCLCVCIATYNTTYIATYSATYIATYITTNIATYIATYTTTCIATYIKTAITEEKLIYSSQFQLLKFCDLPNKLLDEAKYVTVRF